MAEVIDALCDQIADALDGSGLTFALVIWKPGRADNAEAVAVQTPTKDRHEAPFACRVAAECLRGQSGRA